MIAVIAWFERWLDPYPADPPSQPPHRLWAFLWHYWKPAWPMLVGVAVTAALVSLLEVVLYGFLGQLVDRLAQAERASFLADYGWELAGMAAIAVILLPLVALGHGLTLFQGILGPLAMRVRWLGHRWLLGQSLSFFQDDFAGRIATKLMQTSLAVREVAVKLLGVLMYVSVTFLAILALLAQADWRLTLPLIAWLAAYIVLMRLLLPRLRRASEAQSDARSVMTGRIVDSYSNFATIKLFAHTRREEGYARDGMDGFLQTVFWQMRLVTVMEFSLYLINGAMLAGLGALSIGLWLTQSIGLGAVAVGLAVALRLSGMAHWVIWEVSDIFENIGTVYDGRAILSRAQGVIDAEDATPLSVREGRLRFEDVTFHYGKGAGVLQSLTLDIAPGEKIGLVGPSGAGKTTLVNLVLRLFDLEGGRILIDGQDIAQVTQESLRAQIAMVTQDVSLLHRSVRDNILYGRPDADMDQVIAAAQRAQADGFIRDLRDAKGRTGYDAHVGERGVRLSGGQRQRLAIARVFLKDAPILLLDEATSALDLEVEAAIQDSLGRLMAGKTVIAIAHRLSTIISMDRLVVMDKGRIVEMGTHQQLLDQGGLYARLWARQSGGFLGETVATAAAE